MEASKVDVEKVEGEGWRTEVELRMEAVPILDTG